MREIVCRKLVLYRNVRRRSGDGERQSKLIEQVQEFIDAGFQLQIDRCERLKVLHPDHAQLIGRIRFAVMGEHDVPVLLPRSAYEPIKDVQGHLTAKLVGGQEDGLAVKSLGVEEQAIHVEDD